MPVYWCQSSWRARPVPRERCNGRTSRRLSHVQALAVRAPTLGAEVRGVGGLVADLGEFNRVELLVAMNAGLKCEVEDAAGQHGPLHRIRRLAAFEHYLDILDETAEVVMGPALLEIHQCGDRFGLAFDVDCDGEILHQARH